jgi:transposase-like protein
MKKKSLTLFEFQKRYRTEKDCLRALEQLRWSKGFVCPKCGHDSGYRLTQRRVIQCAACRCQTSITAGTIFHKTKLSLKVWFWLIFLVSQDKGGVSALRITKNLGMHYNTVWHMLHKIRQAMSTRDNESIRLAGLIEMDEAYFGGKKRKCQVLVMIESGRKASGSLVMKKVFGLKNANEPGIKKLIEAHVDNQSKQHFVADCAWAHTTPKKMGHVIQTYKSSPASADKHLPWVHLAISLAKRFLLGTYHGVSRKYLQTYLDEFCYRFNRRFKEPSLHESLLRACISSSPINYAAIS